VVRKFKEGWPITGCYAKDDADADDDDHQHRRTQYHYYSDVLERTKFPERARYMGISAFRFFTKKFRHEKMPGNN
jgi:hypothetical protein